MKIPFIQHIGIGLHITHKAIRWVELSRIGDSVKVQKVDVESDKNGDVESCLEALVERQNPSFPYVTVNIDSSYIRQQLVEVPNFDDPEYLNYWIDEQEEKLIPEGLDREDFVLNYHLLGDEGKQKCLFIISKKQALENRKKLLQLVGLKASIITTGHLEAGYGFIYDDEFVSAQVPLVTVFEDGASLHFYDKGMLKNYMELSHSEVSPTDILEEAITYLLTADFADENLQNQTVYLAESDHNEDKALSSVSISSIGEIYPAKPLSNITPNENLAADCSLAAGMAVKQLYPALDDINLQDEASQGEVADEVQKKDALHAGIISGGLVVLIFLCLMAAQFVLNSKLEEANRKVALLQDDIQTVNLATEKVEGLKQQANQARQLVSERTSMAPTLEMIGSSVPDRVWLNEVRLYKSGKNKEAAVYGYAYNDALVASLMGRLENERSTENVRLIFSEAVNSEDIYKNSSYNPMSLVQFEIRLTMNPE